MQTEPTPYYIRIILNSLFGWLIAFLFFVIFIYSQKPYLAITSSVFWLGIYSIRSAIRTKYNLIKFDVDNNFITFTYQKYNRILKTKIDHNQFDIKLTPLMEKSSKMWKLGIYSNNTLVFYQTTIGDWPFEKLKSFLIDLYTEIQKEPSLDTRMTFDWWEKDMR
jgi:hypothetical protein